MNLPKIPTRVCHPHYFGRVLFEELVGRTSFTQFIAFSVKGGGELLSPEASALLDDIAVTISASDPRIWPYKITRLASAFGSLAGLMAGQLGWQQARYCGPWRLQDAAAALLQLDAALEGDRQPAQVETALSQYLSCHSAGFEVPGREVDETIPAIEACIQARQRDGLHFWQTFLVLRDAAKKIPIEPDRTLALAAALLDLGFTPEEMFPLVSTLNQAAFVANAVEASREPQSILQRLPTRFISYAGKPPRISPKKNSRLSQK